MSHFVLKHFGLVLVGLLAACASEPAKPNTQQPLEQARPELTRMVERLRPVLEEAKTVRQFAQPVKTATKLVFGGSDSNAAIIDVRQVDAAWKVGDLARFPFYDVNLGAALGLLHADAPKGLSSEQAASYVAIIGSTVQQAKHLRYVVAVREESYEPPTLAGGLSFSPGKYVITALVYDLEGPKLLGGYSSTSFISTTQISAAPGTTRDNEKMLEEVLYREGKRDLMSLLRQTFEVVD